ncbi:hypothetical protein QQZ08_002255 [Neonectria magnoliae]|uniref:Uncharacterized protein n=1 Tax=Neonectria magnoliae TaxID=2732573 RepID=A0ABR1ICN6_9HYPO
MQTKQESQVSALALKVDSSVQNVWMAGSVLHEKHQRSQYLAVLDGRAITVHQGGSASRLPQGLMEAKLPTTEQFLLLARTLKPDRLRSTMHVPEQILLPLATHQPLVNRKLLPNRKLLVNHRLLVNHKLPVKHKFLVNPRLLVNHRLLFKLKLLLVSQKLLPKFKLLKLPANHKLPVSPKLPVKLKPLVNHRSLVRAQSQTSQFQSMDLDLDLARLLIKAHPRPLHKLLGQQSLQKATLDPVCGTNTRHKSGS